MARRRMISLNIIDTDKFLDMPSSTQALYMHLLVRADDDGFVGNPKRLIRMIGFNEDDLKLLCMKNFVIPFDSGVVVITHWKEQNNIRCDRYTPTQFKEEKSALKLGSNKEYLIGNNNQQFFPQN